MLSVESIEALLSAKVVCFDLDGTLYRGSKLIDGAAKAVESCCSLGKEVYYVTNNSAKTREHIASKLRYLGLGADCDHVVSSGFAAMLHCRTSNEDGVYVCGTEGLKDEFVEGGLALCNESECKTLVVGFDPSFDYEKLKRAVDAMVHASFSLACNRERLFEGERGELFPGCGAMTASVEWCSGKAFDKVVGKPEAGLLEIVSRISGQPASSMVMIGDTPESDGASAAAFGCSCVLVNVEKGERDASKQPTIADVARVLERQRGCR